jgi:glycosyltransferase involved in cell wall biosynthesis
MDHDLAQSSVALSVVVPFFNEEEVLDAFVDQVTAVLGDGQDWELMLVDDGSSDRTAELMAIRADRDARVRPVYLARNYGQTAAMQAGFDLARGAIMVSMDGDLQNDPVDIPRLVEKLGEGYDLVTGYRERRQDKLLTRKIPSWIANRLIRWVTGVQIRDTGCSLKAYRRDLIERLDLYSDMHRFIPAMAVAIGGARTCEIPVRHHPRRFGESKYGLSRIWKVLLDLMVIRMLRSGRESPLRFFASIALVVFGASLAIGVFSLVAIFLLGASAVILPSLSVLSFGLAIHLVTLGMLIENALHQSRQYYPGVVPVAREIGASDVGRRSM